MLLSGGMPDLYAATPATAAAVEQLIASRRGAADDAAAVAAGDGTWAVFYAPHLRTSAAVGVRFRPVQYVITRGGTRVRSDVRFDALGGGWLSAEGALRPRGDGAVDVLFETFWVERGGDAAAAPRSDNPLTSGAPVSAVDAAVNAVGAAVRAQRMPWL